jgi:uncharacterized protein YkwD
MKTKRWVVWFGLMILLASALPAAAQFGTFYHNNITGTRGSWSMRRSNGQYIRGFTCDVPANAAKLQIDSGLTGGYGDCDLFVGYGFLPTASRYSYRRNGNSYRESLTINNPRAGRWYIRLYGYSNYRTSLRFICTRKSTTTYNWRTDMHNRVNNYRRQYGRAALAQHSYIQRAAQNHANEMASYGYYSHTGYFASTRTVEIRVRATGYWANLDPDNWRKGQSENIHAGPTTVAAAMQAWINSTGHRNNILHSSMIHAGYGYKYSADRFGRRWVQVFAFR